MARPAKGSVVRDDRWERPTYSLRFTALGQRHTVRLGCGPKWSQARAEEKLRETMALVRAGKWQPSDSKEARMDQPTQELQLDR